jgi:hypothetical protein
LIPTKRNPELFILECTNLTGVQFGNTPIIGVEQKYSKAQGTSFIRSPTVRYAIFNGATKFDPLGVVITKTYSESYFEDPLPKDPVKDALRGQAGRERYFLPDVINQGSFVRTLDYFSVYNTNAH